MSLNSLIVIRYYCNTDIYSQWNWEINFFEWAVFCEVESCNKHPVSCKILDIGTCLELRSHSFRQAFEGNAIVC